MKLKLKGAGKRLPRKYKKWLKKNNFLPLELLKTQRKPTAGETGCHDAGRRFERFVGTQVSGFSNGPFGGPS